MICIYFLIKFTFVSFVILYTGYSNHSQTDQENVYD